MAGNLYKYKNRPKKGVILKMQFSRRKGQFVDGSQLEENGEMAFSTASLGKNGKTRKY
jgi:hypothetical protein